MIRHLAEAKRQHVVMVTECSMSDNESVEYPEIDFVRPCNLCPHMKQITLAKIQRALETRQYEVTVDEAVADRARRAVERMLLIGRRESV
jgi:quinolinate synthase